jgi:hypothetical protein
VRVRRKVLVTCVEFRADTIFGFIMLCGTERGEVVLYDVATLR